MLKHDLVVQLQASFDTVDYTWLGLEVELHVVTVVLLGVVFVGKLFTTDAIDLLESCAIRFEFFGDGSHRVLDTFFLSLHIEDIDSFVLTFHELWIDDLRFEISSLPPN